MNEMNLREAADRAVDKLAELRARHWRDAEEQSAIAEEYGHALADLEAFRCTLQRG